jgi:general secretion pathway protein N
MRYFPLPAIAVLLTCWSAAAPGADAVSQARDRSGAVPLNPLAENSEQRLSATLDRPLFSPTRRPPPLPVARAAAPPPPPAPPPNVVLIGTVMDGENARALIRTGMDGKMLRAQIGDDVGGWKVSQIEGRKMVLSLDDRFATFMLFNHEDDQRASGNGGPLKVSDGPANSPQQLQLKQNSPPASPDTGAPRRRRRG